MAIGKPSSKPCVECGQHKGNIVEPVSILTKCLDHRKYFTKPEKISQAIYDHCEENLDDVVITDYFIDGLTERIVKALA